MKDNDGESNDKDSFGDHDNQLNHEQNRELDEIRDE